MNLFFRIDKNLRRYDNKTVKTYQFWKLLDFGHCEKQAK